jgi:hypothetical protein
MHGISQLSQAAGGAVSADATRRRWVKHNYAWAVELAEAHEKLYLRNAMVYIASSMSYFRSEKLQNKVRNSQNLLRN